MSASHERASARTVVGSARLGLFRKMRAVLGIFEQLLETRYTLQQI